MIHTTDEEIHGTISSGKHTLTGTIERVELDGFWFKIDDLRRTNWLLREEWTFTPDPTPLPTAMGSVIRVDNARIYGRTLNGWVRLNAQYTQQGLPHHEDVFFEPSGTVEVLFDAGANH